MLRYDYGFYFSIELHFSKYIERLCNIALYFLFYLFTLYKKKIIFLFLHFTFLFYFFFLYFASTLVTTFFFLRFIVRINSNHSAFKITITFFSRFSFYIKIVFFFYNKNERRLVQYRSKRRCQ